MKKVFAETFKGGYIYTSVNSLTLVNNTAKANDFTVPDDTVWILQNIRGTNPDDVQRTVSIIIYRTNAVTNRIRDVFNAAVGAGAVFNVPNDNPLANSTKCADIKDFVLGAGNTIRIYYDAGGASSGGTDADGIILNYRVLSKT